MIAKITKQKRIHEDMTNGELAVMVNNAFTFMQKQVNDLKSYMEKRFDEIHGRLDNLENRFDTLETRFNIFEKYVRNSFDIIDKNMINPYEFQSLSHRVDKIEAK